MRIDSHHHFWNYDPGQYAWITDNMSVLKQDFGPCELQRLCDDAGVHGVISVQARQTIAETDWLLKIADAEPLVQGIVGWVPLASPTFEKDLERFAGSPWLKGVRHVVQDEPDDAFILGSQFNSGIGRLKLYGMVYDILIYAKHLPNTIQFVDQHPDQQFVLDHIAKPSVAEEFDTRWAAGIQRLAERDNVVGCKFSGIVTEVRNATWNLDMIRPYWDTALHGFGAGRLMFGSDWPVCLLRAEYATWIETVATLAKSLSPLEQEQFWSGNAQRVYRLVNRNSPSSATTV
jgi:L-fuconolactonase